MSKSLKNFITIKVCLMTVQSRILSWFSVQAVSCLLVVIGPKVKNDNKKKKKEKKKTEKKNLR